MCQQMHQIEFASVYNAKKAVDKVLNNFWNETNAKINKYIRNQNDVCNTIRIKSEPIEFIQEESNQFSFQILEEVIPKCEFQTVESVKNDRKEIDYNQINKENLKLSINKRLKQTQTKFRKSFTVHLLILARYCDRTISATEL